MTDLDTADPAASVAALPPEMLDQFLRDRIAEKTLTPLVRSLNRDVLSKDARRRGRAEDALRRIGFL